MLVVRRLWADAQWEVRRRQEVADAGLASGPAVGHLQRGRKAAGGDEAELARGDRVAAAGDMQLDRTLKRFMSSAMDLDRPTIPIFAAP